MLLSVAPRLLTIAMTDWNGTVTLLTRAASIHAIRNSMAADLSYRFAHRDKEQQPCYETIVQSMTMRFSDGFIVPLPPSTWHQSTNTKPLSLPKIPFLNQQRHICPPLPPKSQPPTIPPTHTALMMPHYSEENHVPSRRRGWSERHDVRDSYFGAFGSSRSDRTDDHYETAIPQRRRTINTARHSNSRRAREHSTQGHGFRAFFSAIFGGGGSRREARGRGQVDVVF